MHISLVLALVVVALLAAWGARGLWEEHQFLKREAADLRRIAGNQVNMIGELLGEVDQLKLRTPTRMNSTRVVDAADDILADYAVAKDKLINLSLYAREIDNRADEAARGLEEIAQVARAVRSGHYDPRKPASSQRTE
jgi:hypothetical protein